MVLSNVISHLIKCTETLLGEEFVEVDPCGIFERSLQNCLCFFDEARYQQLLFVKVDSSVLI